MDENNIRFELVNGDENCPVNLSVMYVPVMSSEGLKFRYLLGYVDLDNPSLDVDNPDSFDISRLDFYADRESYFARLGNLDVYKSENPVLEHARLRDIDGWLTESMGLVLRDVLESEACHEFPTDDEVLDVFYYVEHIKGEGHAISLYNVMSEVMPSEIAPKVVERKLERMVKEGKLEWNWEGKLKLSDDYFSLF